MSLFFNSSNQYLFPKNFRKYTNATTDEILNDEPMLMIRRNVTLSIEREKEVVKMKSPSSENLFNIFVIRFVTMTSKPFKCYSRMPIHSSFRAGEERELKTLISENFFD